jgi:hypothetical protein
MRHIDVRLPAKTGIAIDPRARHRCASTIVNAIARWAAAAPGGGSVVDPLPYLFHDDPVEELLRVAKRRVGLDQDL